jgi:hypothetical protein
MTGKAHPIVRRRELEEIVGRALRRQGAEVGPRGATIIAVLHDWDSRDRDGPCPTVEIDVCDLAEEIDRELAS